MVRRELVESRTLAQRLVMAGRIRVNGEVVVIPSTNINSDALIVIEQSPQYVSRGGEKLAAALHSFQIDVNGLVCADVGSSTGGFTDCLLQNGAVRVYAIDVGKGILHWKLRQDRRVVVMESTNARFIERLPEPVDLVTIDVSFISIKILLPTIKSWFHSEVDLVSENHKIEVEESVIALIKPQFEAGRDQASRGKGVIRDPSVHKEVLMDVLGFAQLQGFGVRGVIQSPLIGPKGNVEFLTWLVSSIDNNTSFEQRNLEEITPLINSLTT